MALGTVREVADSLVQLRLVTKQQLSDALATLKKPTTQDLLQYLERQSLLTAFHIAKLEKGETTGYFMGRFKVLYQISAGTFARVYRGIDPQTGEGVAIKILRGRHETDPEAIRRFEREAKLIDGFSHPNVVRLIEYGTDLLCKSHYIVLEFIEGGSFREFMNIRKKFEPVEFTRFAVEMADGLGYAHTRGVTHRDISATNVLMAASGSAKWIDFGLAGEVKKGPSGVQYVTEQRTVDYAGLENATGAPEGDLRSDIFFLGSICHEMLTGESALPETRDKKERMDKARFEEIRKLSGRGDVPADLAAIVDKMLEVKPALRYQSCDPILADLKKLPYYAKVVEQTKAREAEQAKRDGGAWSNFMDDLMDSTDRLITEEMLPEPETKDPPRIIISHKSEKARQVLHQKLTEYGYRVEAASDLTGAAAACEVEPADCVIFDLDTTGPEGVDAYKEMVEHAGLLGNRCVGIFLAGESQKIWLKGLRKSDVAFLQKPLTLGPVVKALKQLAPMPNM